MVMGYDGKVLFNCVEFSSPVFLRLSAGEGEQGNCHSMECPWARFCAWKGSFGLELSCITPEEGFIHPLGRWKNVNSCAEDVSGGRHLGREQGGPPQSSSRGRGAGAKVCVLVQLLTPSSRRGIWSGIDRRQSSWPLSTSAGVHFSLIASCQLSYHFSGEEVNLRRWGDRVSRLDWSPGLLTHRPGSFLQKWTHTTLPPHVQTGFSSHALRF